MKIVVLSGSPRKGANTVEVVRVASKKIAGCLGCQYCFAHEGTCVQKDDMTDVIESLKGADMVVFASPIYWFDITAQEKAAIDRLYAFGATGFPFTKTALLLDSHSEGVYDAAIVGRGARARSQARLRARRTHGNRCWWKMLAILTKRNADCHALMLPRTIPAC